MKLHIDLPHLAEVNIWRDESPVPKFSTIKDQRIDLSFGTRVPPIPGIVVVELKQPRGARCLYGLLGLEFKTSDAAECVVRESSPESRKFDGSLLGKIETPKLGLPENSSIAIGESMADELRIMGLSPAGSFDVCYGAAGEISSSVAVFRKLARVLARLSFTEEMFNEHLDGLIR